MNECKICKQPIYPCENSADVNGSCHVDCIEASLYTDQQISRIKAEAVRDEVENLHNLYPHLDGPHLGILTHRANKLERGEL